MTSHPEISKNNRYNLPDAAHADIKLPDIVTVLAPGPDGRFFWDKAVGTVIAVNGAVKIPIKKDIWIVADGNAPKCVWFAWGCNNFQGLKVWSEAIYQRTDAMGDYTFWMYPNHSDQVIPFWLLPFAVDPDFFRPTETVTGIAIDFAVRYGAKEINLIGVDGGGGYFDDPVVAYDNPAIFGKLTELIKYFRNTGIVIRALSPTKLEI